MLHLPQGYSTWTKQVPGCIWIFKKISAIDESFGSNSCHGFDLFQGYLYLANICSKYPDPAFALGDYIAHVYGSIEHGDDDSGICGAI